MAKKGRSTQSLVNAFPSWSSIRLDDQSAGYQFMNTIGNRFDRLIKENNRLAQNYYLPSSIVSDIDIYYKVQLPRSFDFTTEDNDETELTFAEPVVSGVKDGTFYEVSLATDNSIENFWYTPSPDRLSIEQTVSGEQHTVASGYFTQSPFETLLVSGLIETPNHLIVTISGGTSYFGIEPNGFLRRGLIQIDGVTRAGLAVTEELPFVHDETLTTMHEYSEVTEVRAYGVNEPSSVFLSVKSAKFNEPDYPTTYQLDHTVQQQDSPLFWSLSSSTVGSTMLSIDRYDTGDLELRLDGWITKHSQMHIELLDDNSQNVEALDVTVEPFSNRLWIVDSETLYVYDTDFPYPDTKTLLGKDYNASVVIEASNTYTVSGEDVEINYLWKRPIESLVRHRVWVEKPDGQKYSIENGSEVTYHTDDTSWVFGEPFNRQVRSADVITFNERGQHTYSIEATYGDQSSSIDHRIISVVSKTPLAQFDLTSMDGINNDIIAVDFDSEYKLWVLDADNQKHEINRHYDLMLVDIRKKILYLKESYDQIRVYEE